MTQADLFPRRPGPDELFKSGSQNHRIYTEILKRGAISNVEIVHRLNIMNSTGRVSEIRRKLRPYLVNVACQQAGDGGVFVYSLKG